MSIIFIHLEALKPVVSLRLGWRSLYCTQCLNMSKWGLCGFHLVYKIVYHCLNQYHIWYFIVHNVAHSVSLANAHVQATCFVAASGFENWVPPTQLGHHRLPYQVCHSRISHVFNHIQIIL